MQMHKWAQISFWAVETPFFLSINLQDYKSDKEDRRSSHVFKCRFLQPNKLVNKRVLCIKDQGWWDDALKHQQYCSCDTKDKDLPVHMQTQWHCSPRNSLRSASLCRYRRWSPAASPYQTQSHRWRPCLSPGSPGALQASHTYRCDIPQSSPWPAEDESCRKSRNSD